MMELLKFLLLLLSLPFIFGAVIIGIFFIFFYFYVTEASRRARKMSDEMLDEINSWPYEDINGTENDQDVSVPSAYSDSYSLFEISDKDDISKDLDGFGTSSDASEPMEDCPECQGVGVDDNGDPCPSCGGSGTTESLL